MDNTGSSAPAAEVNSAPIQDGGDAGGDISEDSGADVGAPLVQNADQAAIKKLEAKPNLSKSEIKRLNALKIKVDGREYDEALPFDIPDTPEARDWMTKNLQFSKVSQKRMSEYSKLENEAKQFIEQLRKDPKSVLSDPNLGVDLKKMAASILEEEIANSQKSPEQLEKEKLQKELKAIKDERERERVAAQQREFELAQKQAYEQYDMEMTKAIESSDLPKSPYVVKKMADYLHAGLQAGIDLSPSDVLPLIRDEVQEDLRQMFQIMPEAAVEKLLGKDTLTKLRKSSIAKAKGLKAKPPVPVSSSVKSTGSEAKPATPAEKQSFKKYFGI